MELSSDLLVTENQLIVLCGCCGNLFGIHTEPIQEVLAIPEVRPVHHAPPFVRGVFNLRGRVVVLIDPAVKMGAPPQELTPESRILVVHSKDELIGLLVSTLLGVVPFASGQATPNPENLEEGFRKVISSFLLLDGKMVGLLKIDTLLGENDELAHDGGGEA
ncbi:MAG: hypothetical protein GX442_25765 [Candidatus Riflebacteria bacterium]|nr:hypothetical protein [Candidatus Riflebacteria bacterium]